MTKECDHTSVGVIIEDAEGRIALLKRKKFPVGMAPPAGHIDGFGSPENAAREEVGEEVGLTITADGLMATAIQGRRVFNQCRRPNGEYHEWWVYTAKDYEGRLLGNDEETQGAEWYDREQLRELADRTKAYEAGHIPENEWVEQPGLEGVWLSFFVELKYVPA